MTATTTLRKCAGCGFQFRAAPGEEFCSTICSGRAAQAVVYGALLRYAATHPARVG